MCQQLKFEEATDGIDARDSTHSRQSNRFLLFFHFSFDFRCCHRWNEFRSISHVQIKWKMPRHKLIAHTIYCSCCWSELPFRSLALKFHLVHGWWIHSAMNFEHEPMEKCVQRMWYCTFIEETTRHFDVCYLKYRSKYFNNASASCLYGIELLHCSEVLNLK